MTGEEADRVAERIFGAELRPYGVSPDRNDLVLDGSATVSQERLAAMQALPTFGVDPEVRNSYDESPPPATWERPPARNSRMSDAQNAVVLHAWNREQSLRGNPWAVIPGVTLSSADRATREAEDRMGIETAHQMGLNMAYQFQRNLRAPLIQDTMSPPAPEPFLTMEEKVRQMELGILGKPPVPKAPPVKLTEEQKKRTKTTVEMLGKDWFGQIRKIEFD